MTGWLVLLMGLISAPGRAKHEALGLSLGSLCYWAAPLTDPTPIMMFLCPTGLCQGVQVLQKKLLLVPLGHPAEIPCYQDQSTHLNMYWYQQNPGEGLKLMVYSSDAKEETMEKDYGGRWSLNRSDIYNSALKLKEAKMEDEGEYFCASQSLCQGVQVLQKKLLLVPLGQHAEIPCSQDQSTHFAMSWYQQNPREGLKLMVYSSGAKEETMEKDYGGRWSLNRSDIYNSALKLKEAKMEDEGEYFCASSTTDTDAGPGATTKPSHWERDGINNTCPPPGPEPK
eukprot:XP_017945719.1 PREDICTED: uncharacterized protein LOC100493193 [Xenopus tropicalis]